MSGNRPTDRRAAPADERPLADPLRLAARCWLLSAGVLGVLVLIRWQQGQPLLPAGVSMLDLAVMSVAVLIAPLVVIGIRRA
jgi:CHASE2 domain-containing sensor protein